MALAPQRSGLVLITAACLPSRLQGPMSEGRADGPSFGDAALRPAAANAFGRAALVSGPRRGAMVRAGGRDRGVRVRALPASPARPASGSRRRRARDLFRLALPLPFAASRSAAQDHPTGPRPGRSAGQRVPRRQARHLDHQADRGCQRHPAGEPRVVLPPDVPEAGDPVLSARSGRQGRRRHRGAHRALPRGRRPAALRRGGPGGGPPEPEPEP